MSVVEVLLVDEVVGPKLVDLCKVPDVAVDVLDKVELVETEDEVPLVEVVVAGELGGDASVVDSEVLVREVLVRLDVESVSEVCEVLDVVDCSVVDGTEDIVLFVTI